MAKMLGKKPQDRYASMDEVVAALEGNKAAGRFTIQQSWLLVAAGVAVGAVLTALVLLAIR